VACDPIYY